MRAILRTASSRGKEVLQDPTSLGDGERPTTFGYDFWSSPKSTLVISLCWKSAIVEEYTRISYICRLLISTKKLPLIVRRRFGEQFYESGILPLGAEHRGEFGQALQLVGDVSSVAERRHIVRKRFGVCFRDPQHQIVGDCGV